MPSRRPPPATVTPKSSPGTTTNGATPTASSRDAATAGRGSEAVQAVAAAAAQPAPETAEEGAADRVDGDVRAAAKSAIEEGLRVGVEPARFGAELAAKGKLLRRADQRER